MIGADDTAKRVRRRWHASLSPPVDRPHIMPRPLADPTNDMNFAIAVHGDAASSESPRIALRFARAALAKGHRIHRVFFYHAAVTLANSLVVQPQGEPDTAADWARFASDNDIELAVCVAAGLRRGVLGEQDADRYERAAANVRAPFQIVGLGQMIEAAIEADRFVTFCA
jgi:tRNA 2-thiouridine synthesizing protein D